MKTIIFFFMCLFSFVSLASTTITVDEAGSKALASAFKKAEATGDRSVKNEAGSLQYSVTGEISCFYFHSTEYNDCFIAESIRITDQDGADLIESLRTIEKTGNEIIRTGYEGNITTYKSRNIKIECSLQIEGSKTSCLIKP